MNGQKYILYLIFINSFASTTTLAQDNPTPETLCNSDEHVIFSCRFKNWKIASLCASPNITKNAGFIQYRYGASKKMPELIFPKLGRNENLIYDHPKWNFHLYNDSQWLAANSAKTSIAIHMVFTPIEDHPEINFVIDAKTDKESGHISAILRIYESIGKGRTMAEHRCIKETIGDPILLKEIISN